MQTLAKLRRSVEFFSTVPLRRGAAARRLNSSHYLARVCRRQGSACGHDVRVVQHKRVSDMGHRRFTITQDDFLCETVRSLRE
jgi:hypothetical protein